MWAVAKEILGFVGGALLVIPWMRDFLKRTGAAKFLAMRVGGSLNRVLNNINNANQSWLAAPKMFDLWVTVLGLLAVTASFFIGIFIAWSEMSSIAPDNPAVENAASVTGVSKLR